MCGGVCVWRCVCGVRVCGGVSVWRWCVGDYLSFDRDFSKVQSFTPVST